VGLELLADGKPLGKGYSPFTAEKHSVNIPPGVPTAEDKLGSKT